MFVAENARSHADGPVLSQTDLYLLNPKVELHPIMTHSAKNFHLNFNLASGIKFSTPIAQSSL